MNAKQRVIALGFFDGVHNGHGALLRAVRRTADELSCTAAAFTFDRHPASVITGEAVSLLSSVEDRVWMMRRYYGIEEAVVAPFRGMMHMDWQEFLTDYLIRELGAVHLVAGHDFHFGYLGKGNPHRLQETCTRLGVGCQVVEKVEQDGITVSSTYIRSLIAQGEMERAVQFLGHPHILSGRVGHGRKLGGGSLGFPTVNLTIPPGVVIPAFGVYATRVCLEGEALPSVTNVGVRPTVRQDDGRVTVESYILDYQGDLYGRELRVEFYTRLREERRFDGLPELSQAIAGDVETARAYFRAQP